MGLQFITDHDGDIIWLTLRQDEDLMLWRVHMDRALASKFAEAIANGNTTPLWIPEGSEPYNVCVIGNSMGGCVIMVDNGSMLIHKILLSKSQREDLATVLQIHIRASELDTRPKDVLPPMDDQLPSGNPNWTPEKEKQEYDGFDEKDSADWWKK
jgi:hypothetical protein